MRPRVSRERVDLASPRRSAIVVRRGIEVLQGKFPGYRRQKLKIRMVFVDQMRRA